MQIITLGGKRYQILSEGSIRFDFHVEATLRRLGLDQIEMHKGEDPLAFSRRLFDTIIATGQAIEIVALFLVPEGETWSVDGCARVAAHIEALTDSVDKAVVKDLVVQAFMGFFAKGLASAVISRSSLVGAGAGSGINQPGA